MKLPHYLKTQYHLLISSKPVKAFLSFWVWRICEKETHKPEPVQYGEAGFEDRYGVEPDEWDWSR